MENMYGPAAATGIAGFGGYQATGFGWLLIFAAVFALIGALLALKRIAPAMHIRQQW